MHTVNPLDTGGRRLVGIRERAVRVYEEAYGNLCLLDARLRTRGIEAEEGAATAEYAVVLVAATGFAALLVAIMKSETVRKMLLDIVKQALSMGG
ncbi:DUF4244 domain-containing protein [Bifidobacterium sp. 64T4]|uniref:DUF4244 domain-containing protein n=1 Tax=Bifidobacterium pongonis TaxID=2834432 RepID=UPI001C55A4F7|nr:DUF4244 domain-containing protein [Bifidobacterium pongonis]MBW3093788.1 DUF4244 domain-containing protein [Bifidobacterium pongonis]MBW3093923.1 DUF4244 domain-containing protein [Bifidobacterium pongonis]